MNLPSPAAAVLLLLLAVAGLAAACRPATPPEPAEDGPSPVLALPYASSTPVEPGARSGVVVHDPQRAEAGLNLFNVRDLDRAVLTGMNGDVLHRWASPAGPKDGWHHVEPTPDGGLVAVHKLRGLSRLDVDSRVLWERPDLWAHHDAALTGDGGLWVATREIRWIDVPGAGSAGSAVRAPIVDDVLLRLDAGGRTVEEISLYDVLGGVVSGSQWRALREWMALRTSQGLDREAMEFWAARGGATEPFHLNSVELVDRAVPGVSEPGDLLICNREMDMIATIDPVARRRRWTWGPGVLDRPHHPSLLPGGTVLLFDNGAQRGWSRVLEVEPRSGEIVWEYRGDPPAALYSEKRGAAQRLPGGNTLVTVSDAGRVIEVTPDGEVVWELLAPVDRSTDPPTRSIIYRLRRLPNDSPLGGRIPSPPAK